MTTVSIDLTIYDDSYVEGNETFLVQLRLSEANLTVLSNATIVTILDDDSKIYFFH